MRWCFGLLFVAACATAGSHRGVPAQFSYSDAALKCAAKNQAPCTVLLVDNRSNTEDAKVYLYTGRLGTAMGGMVTPFYLMDAQLGGMVTPFYLMDAQLGEGGYCAVVSIHFQLSDLSWTSPRACISNGGYFELNLGAPLAPTSFIPW